MAIVRSRPELYRWRRFNQPASRQKPQFDADNIEHWIKRVEQASEFAVSEAFSLKKTSHSHGFHGPVLDLETTDQLLDHDEAYVEAQELLNDWMNSKLKLELASDEDNDVQNSASNSVPLQEPVAGFQKYKKFDDFYGYLEQEVESTTVQDFLQHLLQSEIVNSGILEDLKTKGIREKKEPRDLRINMELRHKQVKENRLKKQKELELLKQEKALKKLAVSEAQKQLQEEMKRKDLKAKKEEEEIKKQMVILRKELGEKRYLMEEARKMERKRHNLKKIQSLIEVGLPLADLICLNCDNERQKKEEQDKQLELLSKVNTADQKCLRKYFSAWYKFILDLRIKMGKARALADWKCQLKILRAWRDYSWSHKLEKETQKMENQLRDQNRKNQLAIEFNRKCILRHFFAEWQCWSRLEMEKRDLEAKKEKMKRKMATLLEEVSLGQLTSDFSRPTNKIHETEVTQDKPASDTEINQIEVNKLTEVPFVQNNPTIAKSERENSYSPGTSKKCNLHSPNQPKWPWQITRKHAAFNLQDHARFGNQTKHSLQHLDLSKQKKSSAILAPLEQQRLIEEQQQQLQEQQELIRKLQGLQRLHTAWEEVEQTTTATTILNINTPKIKKEKQLRENQSNYKNIKPERSDVQQPVTQKRRILKALVTPHPLLRAMEERAVQRAERRRQLEEAKQKREDEKLAEMQAKEEERERQEAAEKEAKLEKRREEKRLQQIKELEKQKRLEREQQLLSKAEDHYIKVLLKQGLKAWKSLTEQSEENMVMAQRHHFTRLQQKCLLAWLHHTQEIQSRKIGQAEDLYCSQLLRRSFRSWIKYKDYIFTLEESASKVHETALKKKLFGSWFDLVNEEKSILWAKQKTADQYFNRRMILLAFSAWQQFPAQMKEERKKEERLEKLRKRVSEILPNFQA
ncbi:coiled-coil domain-containing protein 191 [Protobothrops mucrosquamatus]|uniref:coiled-coil domain-containing protein 191 n=1 Tax=Protobothrops mucrosquamatus TaxID=103944 RepID=UPI000775C035|nr:coiled-coil domain-containing protein 191 [Protobothrops mucrosquamatus]